MTEPNILRQQFLAVYLEPELHRDVKSSDYVNFIRYYEVFDFTRVR